MKKTALILGILAIVATATEGFFYLRSDAYACRKGGDELRSPAADAGWIHYSNCKYGFSLDIPEGSQVIHATKDTALFPFLPQETEQIIFAAPDPQMSYTVRVFEKKGQNKWQVEADSIFKNSSLTINEFEGSRITMDGSDQFKLTFEDNKKHGFVAEWFYIPSESSPDQHRMDSTLRSWRCAG